MRIGIDLGGTKTAGVALADDGSELARHRVESPRHDYDATIATVVDLVRRLEGDTGQRGTVGVGMPGTLSPLTGRVKNANSVWLNGHRFDRDLGEALGREVRCANDANCLALSEAVDGAAAGHHVVFAAILGTGTGAGVVVDGSVLSGRNGVTGEWGHNPLPWARDDEQPGPACYCGRRGCIETWLSGPGLQRDHRAATGEQLPAEEIAARAQAYDIGADATLHRYVDRLTRALAHVVNVLDPDVIVLGGGLSNIERLQREVPLRLPARVFGGEATAPVRRAAHGDASGVRGAARLWPSDHPDSREQG
ncbi:MAG TPA: ROK family protein [Nitriliruptorales bacterium]|nr:ROK family protein [Nitriliruptorales bacterium]